MTRYVGLSPKQCAGLYWQRFEDYRHAATRHLAPLAGPEATIASAHLPLAFHRAGPGKPFQLTILMGLAEGVNHCLDANYHWQAGYIPAVERMHPFRVLPTKPGGTERALCVDLESPWVTDLEAEPFFSDDGQPSPRVQEILGVLTDLEKHFVRTQQAVEALASRNLIAPWTLEGVGGDPVKGLYRIDEKAFYALPDHDFNELRKHGAVALAYIQMISSHQLPSLQQRAKQSAPAEPVDLEALFGDDDDDDLSFNF